MDYVLGLGANLGSRESQLQAGLELLAAEHACRIVATSHVFESEPHGPPQPRYLNAAARVHSALAPHALLHALLAVERALGRERVQRWGARTLDLDILWAEQAVDAPELRVPHPQLRARWFALRPLLEVAPELAAEYGADLRALAGEEASGRRLHALGLAPRARLQRDGGVLRARGSGLDRCDALAAACSALGRALWPGAPPHTPGAVELIHVEDGGEQSALLAALCARAQRGEAFGRVLLGAHGSHGLPARVIAARAARHTPVACAPRSLQTGEDGAGAWVELQLQLQNG